MNFTITVLGQLAFCLILYEPGYVGSSRIPFSLLKFLIESLPFHISGAIFLILLQFLEKCNCCKCCTSSCCESITQRKLLNVDNPLEQIEFHQRVNEEGHEMEIQI